ncbi:MAG: hydroxypyruvate isomerase family protein [Galactobacter sp.]
MSYTVNCSILLTELDLLDRAAAVREAGLNQAEFWWPFSEAVATDDQVDAFVASLKEAGVQLTGLNFFAGNMAGGDRGIVSWPGREQEFADNIQQVVAIAKATGCKHFNALYGNRQDGQDADAQDALAVANLVAAGQAVAEIGGTVLLEPVSSTDAYPIKTAADALAVIEKVKQRGVDNVKLLADFYHLAVNGDDVPAAIEAHAADFGHIQIADAPGRGAPGTGTLPLTQWIERSQELGYAGPIGLEYKTAKEQAFTWLATANA